MNDMEKAVLLLVIAWAIVVVTIAGPSVWRWWKERRES